MPESAKTPSPICPRCGYDLGGTVAAWVREGDGASCPTEGVCSECGYALLWRDILNPIYQRLPGFYEHANTRRERVVWGWRTTLWLIFPWVFWGKVKLHHTMRPLRAIRLAAWMIVIALLMRAVVAGVGIVVLPGAIAGVNYRWGGRYSGFRPPWSRAFDSQSAFFDACFGPRASWKSSWRPGSPSAITIHAPTEWVISTILPFVFGLAMAAFIVWALPETSRLSKLRPAHAWRAAAYGFVPIGLSALAVSIYSCAIMAIGIGGSLANGSSTSALSVLLSVIVREGLWMAAVPWTVAFWWSAILRAWRLKHGAATCMLLTLGTGAAAAIVSVLIFFALYQTEAFGYWQFGL